MTTIATAAPHDQLVRPDTRLGLSTRLILLTVAFMMIAEVLIYVPAAATFERSWVSDRLMGAQMIVLALSAAPPGTVPTEMENRLVAGVKGAQAIGVRGSGTRWLLANGDGPVPESALTIDLRQRHWWGPVRGAFRTIFAPPDGPTRVIGPGPAGVPSLDWVELIFDQAPLRAELLAFTRNFLATSLVVSGFTSLLLYLALHILVVRPVTRLSANIAGFANDPEDASRIIAPSQRSDEIGAAERALARMEGALASELKQKRRLADLGLAVSKINHELRNMLTTAQLLGDRLGDLDDPSVKRIAPRLIKTLDRAIAYCGATLSYGRASETAPRRQRVLLRPMVMEQLDLTALSDGHQIDVGLSIPDDLEVDADPDQLGRVLLNLMGNAVEALSQAHTPHARIDVSAERSDRAVKIRIADNGPGIPEPVRTRLFSAFQASGRVGGTGLGLPVADELVRLHGGSIALETTSGGASFMVCIPDARST